MEVSHKILEKGGSWMYLISRLMVGLMFFIHGAMKVGILGSGSIDKFASGVGIPYAVAAVVVFIELAGGVAIAAGAFTRLAAFGGAVLMVIAYFMAHAPKGFNPVTNGGEVALLYFAAFLLFFLYGGGKYSLEKAINGKELF